MPRFTIGSTKNNQAKENTRSNFYSFRTIGINILLGAAIISYFSYQQNVSDSVERGLSVLATNDAMTSSTAASNSVILTSDDAGQRNNIRGAPAAAAAQPVAVAVAAAERPLPPPAQAAATTTTAAESKPCPLWHTSKLSSPFIVIDKKAIRAQSREWLDHVKGFTIEQYEQFMMSAPGSEHYTILHYLTKDFHTHDDCRHVVDIGTRYVASSLALGATGVPVKTFDIPTSMERVHAFRGKPEQEWRKELEAKTNVRVEFKNLDLLTIPDEDFRDYMSTWLISLDTFHLPYTVPFEREFMTRLLAMEPKYEGIMILDDIKLNDEMKRWWQELQDNASNWGFVAYDVSDVGHFSGTGLLDFSGKVKIVE